MGWERGCRNTSTSLFPSWFLPFGSSDPVLLWLNCLHILVESPKILVDDRGDVKVVVGSGWSLYLTRVSPVSRAITTEKGMKIGHGSLLQERKRITGGVLRGRGSRSPSFLTPKCESKRKSLFRHGTCSSPGTNGCSRPSHPIPSRPDLGLPSKSSNGSYLTTFFSVLKWKISHDSWGRRVTTSRNDVMGRSLVVPLMCL